MSGSIRLRCTLAIGVAASALLHCSKPAPPPAAPPAAPEWQLLASELPSALLSVGGRSASDVYAVGADKGAGPLVLHFDGAKWSELATGQRGDLWWVQALANGPVLMGGSGGMVLRYDGAKFERIATPGDAKPTVYGVWGASGESFYAVGNEDGKNGFIWHFHDGAFENEAWPSGAAPSAKDGKKDPKESAKSDAPGLFKVFGAGDEVFVVGTGGTVLHRQGKSPFTRVPTTTKETLFTIHGDGARWLAVGGTGNGVLLAGGAAGFRDASPPSAGLLQGVFASDHGDWASGERGMVYARGKGDAAFVVVDHGLELPAASSLHSIFVDAAGGVGRRGGTC